MVDELMCFGWVDSLPKNWDATKSMHRISVRHPKSNWSKVNKDRVDRLIQVSKMEEVGLKMVELAKSSGTWNFLDDVEKLVVPNDLEQAFKTNSKT